MVSKGLIFGFCRRFGMAIEAIACRSGRQVPDLTGIADVNVNEQALLN
jgi:hypothetical protein